MRVSVLQHVPFEGPAEIAAWAEARGHELQVHHLYQGGALPSIEEFDFLVIMGGPMSVNDETEHAWLVPERELIRESVHSGRSILGVCLGAQQLACALGARVFRNPEPEIGWFPLENLARSNPLFQHLPEEFTALHWHGETFELPEGATQLSRSRACEQQAFQYKNALGLQFHLETNASSLGHLIENCADELVDAPFVQNAAQLRELAPPYPQLREHLYTTLDALVAL